jgi:hypothetical protein
VQQRSCRWGSGRDLQDDGVALGPQTRRVIGRVQWRRQAAVFIRECYPDPARCDVGDHVVARQDDRAVSHGEHKPLTLVVIVLVADAGSRPTDDLLTAAARSQGDSVAVPHVAHTLMAAWALLSRSAARE